MPDRFVFLVFNMGKFISDDFQRQCGWSYIEVILGALRGEFNVLFFILFFNTIWRCCLHVFCACLSIFYWFFYVLRACPSCVVHSSRISKALSSVPLHFLSLLPSSCLASGYAILWYSTVKYWECAVYLIWSSQKVPLISFPTSWLVQDVSFAPFCCSCICVQHGHLLWYFFVVVLID